MLNENINLQTAVKIPESPFAGFTAASVVCGTGSCFAENLLSLLYDCGFKGRQNPCGTIYNAVSLAEPVVRIAKNRVYLADDFFEDGGFRAGLRFLKIEDEHLLTLKKILADYKLLEPLNEASVPSIERFFGAPLPEQLKKIC